MNITRPYSPRHGLWEVSGTNGGTTLCGHQGGQGCDATAQLQPGKIWRLYEWKQWKMVEVGLAPVKMEAKIRNRNITRFPHPRLALQLLC